MLLYKIFIYILARNKYFAHLLDENEILSNLRLIKILIAFFTPLHIILI